MSAVGTQTPPADGAWVVACAFQMGAAHNVQRAVAACSVRLPGGAAFALVETLPDPERPGSFAHAIGNLFCESVAKEAARTRPPLKPARALHLLRAGIEAKGVLDDLRECPDQTALTTHDATAPSSVSAIGGALLAVLSDEGGLALAFAGEPTLWLLGADGTWSKCDAILRHGRMLRDHAVPDRDRLLREVLFTELPEVRCAYGVTSALVRDASQATVFGGFQVPIGAADAERAVHQLLRASLGHQRDNPETSDGVGVVCAVRCQSEAVGRSVSRPALFSAMAGALGIGALVGAAALQVPLYPPTPTAQPVDPPVTATGGPPAGPAPLPAASSASADDLLPDCPVEGGAVAAPAALDPTPVSAP